MTITTITTIFNYHDFLQLRFDEWKYLTYNNNAYAYLYRDQMLRQYTRCKTCSHWRIL